MKLYTILFAIFLYSGYLVNAEEDNGQYVPAANEQEGDNGQWNQDGNNGEWSQDGDNGQWNQDGGNGQWDQNGGGQPSESNIALDFPCPDDGNDGQYFAHPNDTTKFIRCVSLTAIIFQCGPELVWDDNLKTCGYPVGPISRNNKP